MRVLLLFGTKFQSSCKRREDEEGKQSNQAAMKDLVLTFCPTMRSFRQRKLKLLMPVLNELNKGRELFKRLLMSMNVRMTNILQGGISEFKARSQTRIQT